MVISDLDGTLLNDRRLISDEDLNTLRKLGTIGILRVIATGRNLFSARKVLETDLPIDYLIFSSGAGIMDWTAQKLLYKDSLPASTVSAILPLLFKLDRDFMIHQPVPDNHFYYFHKSVHSLKDFQRRHSIYQPYAIGTVTTDFNTKPASQILIVSDQPEQDLEILRSNLKHLNIIRTTSPLDGKTTWIEIFPKNVSKAHAAQWLLDHLSHRPPFTLAVGNDYNDHDLLQWADIAYVVANGTQEMRTRYPVTRSGNMNHGFSEAVRQKIIL